MNEDDLIRRVDALAAVMRVGDEQRIAAIPALKIKVKPLEWVKMDETYYYAAGEDIKITSNGQGWGLSPRDWPHLGGYDIPTLDAAKAAAQADYEARILSAIQTG